MKKQEKLHVTLPSIPIAFDAFAPPTMQDLSTYFIVVPIRHHALKIIDLFGCFCMKML
jgi:hypothetical protein